MPNSKIETCEIELSIANNNISKFLEEHKVNKVKTKREILNNFQKLKDSYLLSKNVFDFHTVVRVQYHALPYCMVFDIISDVTGRIQFNILYLYVIHLCMYL